MTAQGKRRLSRKASFVGGIVLWGLLIAPILLNYVIGTPLKGVIPYGRFIWAGHCVAPFMTLFVILLMRRLPFIPNPLYLLAGALITGVINFAYLVEIDAFLSEVFLP